MLFVNFIKFLKGYVFIKISGSFPERFLNLCANKGILLWNIAYSDDKSVICAVSMKGYTQLAPIARKTGTEIEIISRHGLPYLMKKYKKRKWFAIGAALFVAASIFLNQFVWEIEITGCEKVSKNLILENLAELGVKTGTPRFMIDERIIKDKMLLKMPELAWLWADKSGSRLVVTVRETMPTPEIFDPGDYTNIIAKKDGIIKSMTVKSGTPLVADGDTVLKDDILVSGLMISERGIEPRYIQAEATVYASVWYEETEKFPLFENVKTETGNVGKVRNIKLFGLSFTPFWYKRPAFAYCDMESSTYSFELFGKYMGLTVNTEEYREYTAEKEIYDEESAVQTAVRLLLDKIDSGAATDSELVSHSYEYTKNDDETVTVTVIAEYLESIGEKVKISG